MTVDKGNLKTKGVVMHKGKLIKALNDIEKMGLRLENKCLACGIHTSDEALSEVHKADREFSDAVAKLRNEIISEEE